MTRFEDLSDDCLIEVFNWLSPGQFFKMQRLNKRMKRLAEVKMRTNIKAITWINANSGIEEDALINTCEEDHLGSSSHKQVLFLRKKHKDPSDLATRTLFLHLLTKCTGIKSLEFVEFELPGNFLFEVVRRCPELECFKLLNAVVKEKDWSKLLDQIGHKLVHVEICDYFIQSYRLMLVPTYKVTMAQVHNKLMAMVAAKCSNIKRVDWVSVDTLLTEDKMTTLKLFPKNCWVSFDCNYVDEGDYEDIFDELVVRSSLDWSALGNRNTRLSKFTFSQFSFDDGPIRGVEFASLKHLKFYDFLSSPKSVNALLLSRFPRLEELTFNATCIFTEAVYVKLFQHLRSVKKLTIYYGYPYSRFNATPGPVLPRSSIKQLRNLEIIVLDVFNIKDSWQPEGFVKKIEPYVHWISSLKKMTIKFGRMRRVRNTKKVLKEGVKRMRQKQKDVEIGLTFAQ